MEIKKLFLLQFEKGLFKEKKLVFDAAAPGADEAGESAEKEKQSPEDKALQFLAVINDLETFEGGEDPASVLRNNPYADSLFKFVEKFEDKDFVIDNLDHIPGRLTLRYPAGEIHVFGEVYNAIYWKEIKAKIDGAFTGRNVSDELIFLSYRNSKKFRDFVDYLAGNPSEIEASRVDVVLADMEGLRSKLRTPEAGKKLGKAMIEADSLRSRAGVSKEISHAPSVREMTEEAFLKKVNDPKRREEFNRLKVNTSREALKINVDKWDQDHNTIKGLDKIYQDCRDLQIINQDPAFYKTMFAILRNAADKDTSPHLRNKEKAAMFQNPLAHRKDIEALPAKDGFWGGEQFMAAYDRLIELQGIVLGQDQFQQAVGDKQASLDEDPIADKVTDFVQRNLATFKKAIKEKDYATAGMYAVGIYALYKAYNKIANSEKGGKIGKWVLYGAAAYAGTVFARNAGYDILKMAGFRDEDYEVKGTPMEVMRKILSNNPQLWEKTKDIDYNVVLRMSSVNLVTLDNLYQESNAKGVQFIHPKDFRSIFPDLASAWSFEMGQHAGFKGRSNSKLTAKQEEYVRVGQQIYKIALGLRGVYDETLRKEGAKEFRGVRYEDAIKKKDINMAHMWQLFDAASPWAAMSSDDGTFSRRKQQDLEDGLQEAFEDEKQAGVGIDRPIGEGDYLGHIKGFPVVFVTAKEGYRVYLMNNYNDGKEERTTNPGGDFIAVMPFTGPQRAVAAEKAVKEVDERMKDLIRTVVGSDGRDLVDKGLVYEDGTWKCPIKFAKAEEYGINVAKEAMATIVPHSDGKGIFIESKIGDVKINLDEETAKHDPTSYVIIPALTDQPEFRALQVLGHAGRLKIDHGARGDSKFKLKIGKTGLFLDVLYRGKFILDPASPDQEKNLLKNPLFANEFIDAVANNKDFELNKTAEDLKELIENATDEDFVMFFVKTLLRQTHRGELEGFNTDIFSGTVPENFTNMLIDTAKYAAMSQLRRGFKGKNSLSEINDVFKDTISDVNLKMKAIYDNISAENLDLLRKGDEWDRLNFMLKVTDKIRSASARSGEYARSRSEFEGLIYGMNLPGFMAGSDFNKVGHKSVEKLINVFSYYTAHLDNPGLDGLAGKPPEGAAATPEALEPYYKLRYFEYVKMRIVNEAQNMAGGGALRLNAIHEPGSPSWKIDDFEVWKESGEADYRPIDPMDVNDPWKHDLADHEKDPPDFTKLELELVTKFDNAVNTLKDKIGGDLNEEALHYYLYNDEGTPNEMGLLVIYPDPDNSRKPTCKIWGETKLMAEMAGNSRGKQIRLMEKRIDEFYEYVFSEPGRDLFFNKSPGWWERIKRGAYEIKYGF